MGKIKRTYVKTASEATFRAYPESVKELFRHRRLSYISSIEVQGYERQSKSKNKIIQKWSLVKAFAPDANGNRTCVITVTPQNKPTFETFGGAMQNFTDEAIRTGYRCYFDRTDRRTYEEDPAATAFFESRDTRGIRYVDVYYRYDYGGYVAHARKENGRPDSSIPHGAPFNTPQEATRNLLQRFRERDEGFSED